MAWGARYHPTDLSYCQGRKDTPAGACFFQIIQALDLSKPLTDINPPAFCLLGFRCDEGVRRNLGRVGAIDGPAAIREMIARLPIQKTDIRIYDAGDVQCTDGDLESAQTVLAEAIHKLLEAHLTPIVIGGGHELAWGHYQGIAAFTKENLGIINFDAHFDMRPLLTETKGSSGTPFLQIAHAHQQTACRFDYNCIGIQATGNIPSLFTTAEQHDVKFIPADDLHQGHFVKCSNFVERVINDNEVIYLSQCLDVFAAPYAPGVSAPQPLGVLPWHLIPLLRQVAASGKTISYDIAEMSPKYDIDQRTAKLAASLIFEIVHHHQNR